MVLPRLNSNTSSRQITWFINDYAEIDLESPYQRTAVWGEERQRALIKSLLMEYPIPAIIVNDRLHAKFYDANNTDEQNISFGVIDGKQRITAIRNFTENKFYVPHDWFEETNVSIGSTGDTITYADLTIEGKRFFRMRSIPVVTTLVATIDEEASIFETINTAGLDQGKTDF